ncbi:MAG: ribonuclease R [Neomegalonema sp.]|nr:ribonuclease R [Neomegalonema sp.]
MPKTSPLPTKDELLEFIRAQDGVIGKRELARAFNLKSGDRIELKRLLAELKDEGLIEGGRRRMAPPREHALPPVLPLDVLEPDENGDLPVTPANWHEEGPPPRMVLAPPRKHDPVLAPGDRFLGRHRALSDGGPYAFEARIVKKIPKLARRVLGLFQEEPRGGGRILPTDKKNQDEFAVDRLDCGDAKTGELVEVELLPGTRFGLRKARVIDRLGDPTEPRAFSLIAIHEQGIPIEFDPEVLEEAENAEPLATLGNRLDLRHLPFVTIDPADARDHDDAVLAEPDADEANPGGWVVWVAIADVAHYVRPFSALDRSARSRGNSAYFPDRVVPMLPERLSGDLCSLHEGVDRPCLAVRMVLSSDGLKRSHKFYRVMIRSLASLTYEQAQSAWEGEPDAVTEPLIESVIDPLFKAFHAAEAARERRGPLELDLPERKVTLNDEGAVESIRFRERVDAHRVIEDFMILANVCAAETLEEARRPLLYRVHEEPNPEKIEALREVLASVDVPLAKGQVMTPKILNRALEAVAGGEHAELVNMAVLRAQTQAYYTPENYGHFGLALPRYAHFTSPIRRYADLVVHRALIAGLRLGDDGQTMEEIEGLAATGEHISMTERRAMTAERDTIDRYLAAYLGSREGGEFAGRIAGVQRFGLFVKLHESGADGFVPIASLGDEFFHFDEAGARLVGERSGIELRMGDDVRTRLVEATPVTGGLILEILDLPSGKRTGRGGGRSRSQRGAVANPAKSSRRAPKAKIARAKAARKAKRDRALGKKK